MTPLVYIKYGSEVIQCEVTFISIISTSCKCCLLGAKLSCSSYVINMVRPHIDTQQNISIKVVLLMKLTFAYKIVEAISHYCLPLYPFHVPRFI